MFGLELGAASRCVGTTATRSKQAVTQAIQIACLRKAIPLQAGNGDQAMIVAMACRVLGTDDPIAQ